MKSLRHVIVPASSFNLEKGEPDLVSYSFNTKQAKHLFCSKCGVQSFYVPRSNPDGYSVMPNCIDEGTVTGYITKKFDGHNWEASMAADNSIQQLSKE